MAQSTVQQTFTRYTHPDPKINQIVQDIYDKLDYIKGQVVQLQQPSTSKVST